MHLTKNARLRRRGGSPMSGPPEIVRERRRQAVRQAGIEDAKAAAKGRREKLREAFS